MLPGPDSYGLVCARPQQGTNLMRRPFAVLHGIVFVAFLTAWTIALLSPVPNKSAERVLGGEFWVFMFGKGLHISAYAFLTVLGGTIVLFGRHRRWVFMALVAHGATTEFFQQFVGRTASIRDVLLDAIGILIGCLVIFAWRQFTKPKNTKVVASTPPLEVLSEVAQQHLHPTSRPIPSRPTADR